MSPSRRKRGWEVFIRARIKGCPRVEESPGHFSPIAHGSQMKCCEAEANSCSHIRSPLQKDFHNIRMSFLASKKQSGEPLLLSGGDRPQQVEQPHRVGGGGAGRRKPFRSARPHV